MLLRKVALMLVLSLLVISCGDDSTSPNDEGDAPALPTFNAIEADLSFFLENNPQKAKQAATNFNTAKSFALVFSSVTSFGQVYAGFFQGASGADAEFKDGAWVWDYDYAYQGESATVELTSKESGNQIIWDMTVSYSGPEFSYEDYTIVEGQTSKDGNSGSWTFNSLSVDGSEEVPFMVSTWEKTSDTEVLIETSYYGDNGSLEGAFTYTQNANDFMLTATGMGSDNSAVHWNTDTQEGYYDTGSDRLCWDSDLQDAPC